jgi:hypothetical protein
MAVAVIMEFNGATLEQYDQVIEKMGLTKEGPAPAGALSHWVAATDNGILVTDLWKSRELYDAFARDQIGPFSEEAGIPAAAEDHLPRRLQLLHPGARNLTASQGPRRLPGAGLTGRGSVRVLLSSPTGQCGGPPVAVRGFLLLERRKVM